MTVRETPAPMPVALRDNTNITLQMVRGRDARYAIRRIVAEAYAQGFADGRIDQLVNDSSDRMDEAEYARRDAESATPAPVETQEKGDQ